MLLAVYFHEEFIDIEGIAVSTMLTLQAAGINGSEFDTPKPDRLSADSDASLSKEIFDITVAEIEAIVEPDGIADDIGGELVSFIGIHAPILSISAR